MSSNAEPKTPDPRRQDGESTLRLASTQSPSAEQHMNAESVKQNEAVPFQSQSDFNPAAAAATFRSTTIAPSPPPNPSIDALKPPAIDTTGRRQGADSSTALSNRSPSSLRVQTDLIPGYTVTSASSSSASNDRTSSEATRTAPKSPLLPIQRTPSFKRAIAAIEGTSSISSTPNSTLSSPMLSALVDVTPLPSPIMSGDSPGPWKKLIVRPGSREGPMQITADSALVTANGESISAAIMNQNKRRTYQGLMTNANEPGLKENASGHSRNRSISEYVPETAQVPKVRHVTVSGSHAATPEASSESLASSDSQMRREPHLAVQRGLAPIPSPPTPPSSKTGGESSDRDSSLSHAMLTTPHASKKARYQYFDARTRGDSKRRRWRGLRLLGEGTFSKVVLATSQAPEEDDRIDENAAYGQEMNGASPVEEQKLDRKKLVAIKICEHGPKGGASEERVEMSLKRELEIMKSIDHPSLVHLKAWSVENTRAILVLSYCPGGDLFEVASLHRDLLVPGLLRRMFAELVAAVQYLHERHIVHRDIKLENVLVNLPQSELAKDIDWNAYRYSVITLTDLGLSRRVADDEKLTTRCGSDDYAAPEVIMGQPYDGRAVDAWSLGVLLYALLEARLPFDPHPGMSEAHKQRSRTSHRIARVEWKWVLFAGDDGDNDGDEKKFEEAGLKGAMNITEGLLKRARSRWPLAKVAEQPWVKDCIQVEGGPKFREEDIPDEVEYEVESVL